MKITVCHKSGAVINLTADDYCHIEVDGKIVWYPEVDGCASKSGSENSTDNTESEEISLLKIGLKGGKLCGARYVINNCLSVHVMILRNV